MGRRRLFAAMVFVLLLGSTVLTTDLMEPAEPKARVPMGVRPPANATQGGVPDLNVSSEPDGPDGRPL